MQSQVEHLSAKRLFHDIQEKLLVAVSEAGRIHRWSESSFHCGLLGQPRKLVAVVIIVCKFKAVVWKLLCLQPRENNITTAQFRTFLIHEAEVMQSRWNFVLLVRIFFLILHVARSGNSLHNPWL